MSKVGNPYHEPAGSPKGGQFASKKLGTFENAAREAAGLDTKLRKMSNSELKIKYKELGGEETLSERSILHGFYDPNEDVIYINNELQNTKIMPTWSGFVISDSFDSRLAHEEGHRYWYTKLSEQQRQTFSNAYFEVTRPKWWTHMLSMKANSPEEAFAELYSAEKLGFDWRERLKEKSFRKARDLFSILMNK